ncbi:SHC-transforming protein 1-like [Asterias rubens]|uniref:SHC-transforming protein 1-like n=1 Tax=Asterias rubens TaxID=7604 RepID=UPI001455BBE7|nr:SHC-transforming protein 1-like [Asterias rubens]
MNHFKKNKGPNTVGQRPNEELWTRTGTFVNKPNKGWLHSEEMVKKGGVCYGVKYVGCIEVKQSMRTLPFEMRGQVTKEAIFRVCDAAGFRYNRKKKGSKSINKILGETPNIQFGGANVNLTISTSSITLTIMETGQIIAGHQMQGISFASGGDAETTDYVAYVGKDPVNGRACHILECIGGLAQDTITTIGQAFEIRFKDYLKNPPQAVSAPDRLAEPIFGEEESAWGDDPEYYNDIHKFTNIPQESYPPPPPPGQYMGCQNIPDDHAYQPLAIKPTAPPVYDNREGALFESRDQHLVNNNQRQPAVGKLLDIDDTPHAPALDNPLSNQPDTSIYDEPKFDGANYDNPKMPLVSPDKDFQEGIYNIPAHSQPLNMGMSQNGQPHPSPTVDAFDMEPFNPVAPSQKDQGAISPPSQFVNSSAPPVNARVSPPVQQATPPPPPQFQSKTVVPPPPTHKPPPPPGANPTTSPRDPPPRNGQPSKVPPPSSAAQPPVKKTIRDEEWFHGPMTRKIGEALLEEDGEFLVRESTTTPGQYVLSGMLNGQPKHLLLVDPQGRVRTKDKEFESVSHLIDYHRNNNLPIISGGSAVYLQHPVLNAQAAGQHYN